MADQRTSRPRPNLRQQPAARRDADRREAGAHRAAGEERDRRDDNELEPVEVNLLQTPEACAAHAAHGTTAHIRAAALPGEEDDEADDAEDERRDHDGRKVTDVFPHLDEEAAAGVTRVGFDDGSQYEVHDGKLKKVSGNSESKSEVKDDSASKSEDK